MAVVPALMLGLSGCGGWTSVDTETPSPASSSAPQPPSASPTLEEAPAAVLVYEVEGVATDASVTTQTPTGTSQQSIPSLNVNVTRNQRWTFPEGFAYISIQGGDENTYVTCRIKMGKDILSENSSDAPYGIATCQASL